MKVCNFLFLFLFSFSLLAQNGPSNPLSARSNGVSNASIAFTGINSIFNNQAGLASLENSGILFSGQQTFINPNSDNFGVGFAIPTTSGTFGIDIHHFINDDLNQIILGFAYARKLMPKLSAGIQFEMRSSQFAPYERLILFSSERKEFFTAEIGLQYKLLEKLLIGVHFSNPAKLEIKEDEFLPRIIRAGATYFVSEKLLVHAELEKDFELPFVFKSGLEWELADELWLRIGFHNKPITFNLGTGYKFKNGLRIDFACYYQNGLDLVGSGISSLSGFIPSFGIGFDFKKKERLKKLRLDKQNKKR